MQEAPAPSTRAAYTYRWRVFTGWCQAHQTDPFLPSTQDILLFLQSQLETRKSAVTLRGMVPAIKAVRIGEFAVSEDGCSMISQYLKCARRSYPVHIVATRGGSQTKLVVYRQRHLG